MGAEKAVFKGFGTEGEMVSEVHGGGGEGQRECTS